MRKQPVQDGGKTKYGRSPLTVSSSACAVRLCNTVIVPPSTHYYYRCRVLCTRSKMPGHSLDADAGTSLNPVIITKQTLMREYYTERAERKIPPTAVAVAITSWDRATSASPVADLFQSMASKGREGLARALNGGGDGDAALGSPLTCLFRVYHYRRCDSTYVHARVLSTQTADLVRRNKAANTTRSRTVKSSLERYWRDSSCKQKTKSGIINSAAISQRENSEYPHVKRLKRTSFYSPSRGTH